MALTQAQIDAIKAQLLQLNKAVASGALIVRHADTTVQYRSLSEMESIIAGLEEALVAAEGGTPISGTSRIHYSFQSGKGL
jgi:hypothetical protein